MTEKIITKDLQAKCDSFHFNTCRTWVTPAGDVSKLAYLGCRGLKKKSPNMPQTRLDDNQFRELRNPPLTKVKTIRTTSRNPSSFQWVCPPVTRCQAPRKEEQDGIIHQWILSSTDFPKKVQCWNPKKMAFFFGNRNSFSKKRLFSHSQDQTFVKHECKLLRSA